MNTARINKVIEKMQREGLSQILVSSTPSVYYLTGAWVDPGERLFALHIRDNGDVRLYANRLFALNGTVEVPLTEFDDTDDCIGILADGMQGGELGVDKQWPSGFAIPLMQRRQDIRMSIGSHTVDEVRMIKDAEELDLMRVSSQKNVQVCRKTGEALYEGMPETEAYDTYIRFAKELGASGPSFAPLICYGANCAEPHHSSDETRLKKGDSVIIDVGLLWKRYCSDMTRTLFFGEPTDEQKKVYDIVYRANRAAIAAARPGVKMKDIDRAARALIEAEGYGPYFIHRTGHGIGLEVHETIQCSAVSEQVADPGMVFSIEPGIYLPGRFGVRYEDLIAITEDGCEVLTAHE